MGPCKIVRKFSLNAYEIELPTEIGISSIFNVADLYLYREPEDESQGHTTVEENPTVNWEEQMQELQEDVKRRLQESSRKYKQRVDMRRREKEFQVGDLVMVYLRK